MQKNRSDDDDDEDPLSCYTQWAGQTKIASAPSDDYGNAKGNDFDLAKDGAFKGYKIAVVQLYACEFKTAQTALEEKGFSVQLWKSVPPLDEFKKELQASCQFWLISGQNPQLSSQHIDAIEAFFNEGKGVYVWGDNDPYYADANAVGQRLFGSTMFGNVPGQKVVNECKQGANVGFLPHLITTGLTFLYEGYTVATIKNEANTLQPLLWGSAANLITVTYDKDGKRAVFDGAFTRLYCNWDTAGTGRYVKNAASWLVNWERFHPPRPKKSREEKRREKEEKERKEKEKKREAARKQKQKEADDAKEFDLGLSFDAFTESNKRSVHREDRREKETQRRGREDDDDDDNDNDNDRRRESGEKRRTSYSSSFSASRRTTTHSSSDESDDEKEKNTRKTTPTRGKQTSQRRQSKYDTSSSDESDDEKDRDRRKTTPTRGKQTPQRRQSKYDNSSSDDDRNGNRRTPSRKQNDNDSSSDDEGEDDNRQRKGRQQHTQSRKRDDDDDNDDDDDEHICPWGMQCRDRKNSEHKRNFKHPERDRCKYHDPSRGKRCKDIHVMHHRLQFTHDGIRDVPTACRYGMKCRDMQDPDHQRVYAHN